MEDFGFERGQTKEKVFFVSKKIFWASATLFSLACFLYITISSYSYFYNDKNSKIETITTSEKTLKSFENAGQKHDSDYSKQIDRAIYEDIFGSKNSKIVEVEPNKVKKLSPPTLPPKKEVKKQTDNKTTKVRKTNKYEEKELTIKAKKRSRIVRVQIAAMTSKDGSRKAWNDFQKKYPDLFKGLTPYVQEVDLGKRGVFYRLQAGEFFNQLEAEKFCEKYVSSSKKSRSDCIIVE